MENRFVNSILLSAIGDALGWITEFEKSEETIHSKYGVRKIESFYNWQKFVGGRFNGYKDEISSGAYSDDTQLLLSVARSINSYGTIDNKYFSKIELPAWLQYSRGAGRTIKNAANKITRISASWNNNFFTFNAGNQKIDYRESGANGAAMRILPLALANFNDQDKIKECIFSNSIVTHGHPRAIVGAILYGIAVNEILKQNVEEFSFETYLTCIGKDFEKKFEISFITNPLYSSWLAEWNKRKGFEFLPTYNKTVKEALEMLRIIYRNLKDKKNTKDTLNDLGCFNTMTKGSGISTVIGGIFLAVKHYSEPEIAIVEAVNLIGADTDSIAAFTGGLLGALYETKIIPDKWENVQDSNYLKLLAGKLYKISLSQQVFEKEREQPLACKSLNDINSDSYLENDKILFIPLGEGTITKIDRQKTLTSGKYILIIDVTFQIGQSCRFSKLLDIEKNKPKGLF
jgi:ADP-ribosylglycohydrolase